MAKKIFVRGPNWIGDVVMATPVLRSLRRQFPQAQIHLGLRPYAVPIIEGFSEVDHIHSLPSGGVKGVLQTAKILRAFDFDLAILLTNSFGSALEARLGGIKRRRGYVGDGRSLLLTEPQKPLLDGKKRLPMPMAQFYFRLIEGLGCKMEAGESVYTLPVLQGDKDWVADWWSRHGGLPSGPLIGLNPGAKFGASKLWPSHRFAEAGDRMVEEWGGTLVLLGGPGEEELLAEIAALMKNPCINSLDELIPLAPLRAMIQSLACLLTTDTGPRAIAQALGVPSVVLMGPTHPGWTDLNNEKSVIVRHDVPCGPCHKKICDLDHRCMTEIEVDEVVVAVRTVMAQ